MQQIKDIKAIVASNLVKYRKEAHLTQQQLADKINYSDKAISKWERGESIPDIYVLKIIADLYNVEVSDLLKEKTKVEKIRSIYHNKIVITILSSLLVWLAAVVAFVLSEMIAPSSYRSWLSFIYAIPLTFIVLVVFNNLWGKRLINLFIVSALSWTTIMALVTTLDAYVQNMWMLYLIGIVLELLIVFWYMLDLKRKTNFNKELTEDDKKTLEKNAELLISSTKTPSKKDTQVKEDTTKDTK